MKNILTVLIVLSCLCMPGEANAPSTHTETELNEKLEAGAAEHDVDVSSDD